MKTYVITLSRKFPTGHHRAGEPTHFWEKFIKGQDNYSCIYSDFWETTIPKLHTIRGNYPLWAKRIAEVARGKACLSIRQWAGKPYRSKQVEFAKLTKEDGIGVQRLDLSAAPFAVRIDDPIYTVPSVLQILALNDGLSLEDWEDWFKGTDKSQPMAIIHFTKFRY